MSASSEPPRPMLSDDVADLLTAGVVVEIDATEAEELGAFLESALTEAEAWAANADLAFTEDSDGE